MERASIGAAKEDAIARLFASVREEPLAEIAGLPAPAAARALLEGLRGLA